MTPADTPVEAPVETPVEAPPVETPPQDGLLDRTPEALPPDPDDPVRPENIPERYWNEVDGIVRTDELMTAYDKLRNEFNTIKNDDSGIPETAEEYFDGKFNAEGDFIFRDEMKNVRTFDKDDPLLKGYGENALKWGLTHKQADGFLQDMITSMDTLQGEGEAFDAEVEMAKLGKRAKERVDGVEVYLNGLKLSTEEMAAAKMLAYDAVGIQVLERFMGEAGQLSIPLGTAADSTTKGEMEAEYDRLLGDPEALDNDPVKRARFESLGVKLHPDTNEG